MPTQYPAALDNFANPLPGDKLNAPSHSGQHTNANDAIEAVQAYVGIEGSTDPDTITGQIAGVVAEVATKQDELVSGVNIKTINGNSILGPGDLVIEGGGGGTTESFYNYGSADADVNPGTGNISIESIGGDNRRIAASKIDADGVTRNLSLLLPGDGITVTDDPTTPPVTGFARYVLTSNVTDMGLYYVADAIRADTAGSQTPPAAGTRLRVLATLSGGGGTGTTVDWPDITNKPTTIAGYGITDAYTKTETDARYPLKDGSGATGTWPVNVTGNAATSTVSDSVENTNGGAAILHWKGTQAQYDAIATKDANTWYAIVG